MLIWKFDIDWQLQVHHSTALLWQIEASDESDISWKEQNVSAISSDVNGISWCLT